MIRIYLAQPLEIAKYYKINLQFLQPISEKIEKEKKNSVIDVLVLALFYFILGEIYVDLIF